jgi:hypothetical protein
MKKWGYGTACGDTSTDTRAKTSRQKHARSNQHYPNIGG